MSSSTKQWTVAVSIDEHPDQRNTVAHARMRGADGHNFTGTGTAARFPRDPELPMVGDELAVARALADLAQQLTSTAYRAISDEEGPRWENW
jgi:uncharacterized protein DUF1876